MYAYDSPLHAFDYLRAIYGRPSVHTFDVATATIPVLLYPQCLIDTTE